MSDENRESPSHPTLAPTTSGDFPVATAEKKGQAAWGSVVYRLVVVGLLASIAYDLKWGMVDVGYVKTVGSTVYVSGTVDVGSVEGRVDVGSVQSRVDVGSVQGRVDVIGTVNVGGTVDVGSVRSVGFVGSTVDVRVRN